jgi:hypothetical protein
LNRGGPNRRTAEERKVSYARRKTNLDAVAGGSSTAAATTTHSSDSRVEHLNKISSREMRHSFVSMMVDAGFSLVGDYVGHSRARSWSTDTGTSSKATELEVVTLLGKNPKSLARSVARTSPPWLLRAHR